MFAIRNRSLRHFVLLAIAAPGIGAISSSNAVAQIVSVGSTYNIGGTNFPTNFGPETVTLDLTPKLINGGQLRVTETVFPTAGGGAWLDVYFERVSGGSLAGNINGAWDFYLNHLIMTQSAIFDGAYKYWTVNGAAVNPIFPFGGFTTIGPHPVNPAIGPVYLSSPNFGPFTQLDFTTLSFISPYSLISNGGMNPNTANGFHHGFHFSPVPEPASLVLGGLAAGVGGLVYRRRRDSLANCPDAV